MTSQVLCYVQRKRITDWKRLVLTHDSPAFIYGSKDDRVFASRLSEGSILWVVSSIPGRNPELVARMELAGVWEREDPKLKVSPDLLRHFREFKWIAKGTSNSAFLGHNDAGPALVRTVFERASGSTWTLAGQQSDWRAEYGSRLQRPTVIHIPPEGSPPQDVIRTIPLQELSDSARRSVFISWKWRDNHKTIPLSLAYALAKNGLMVWLDLLALPRARALKLVQRDEAKLERLLRYGYGQCVCVLAIDSAKYGTQTRESAANWTLKEWNGELNSGQKLARVCFSPGCGVRHSPVTAAADVILSGTTPDEAARELRVWLHAQPV